MKILITGVNGQLGTAFGLIAPAWPQHQFILKTRTDLDICNGADIRDTLVQTGAQALVNCAAYTAVDKAETEQEAAFAINATAPGIMAAVCKDLGVKLVHISTDYVFSGEKEQPYRTDDPVQPVNVYGASKQKGEEAVLQSGADAAIIRTSWVYAPFGANFVKTMVRLMQSRPEVGVVADQYGSPTNAIDLAHAIAQMLESAHWQSGIYHYSNEGVISWYDFALAIRDLGGFSCEVKSLTTPEYPTPAKRPHFSVMDKSRIQEVFGIKLRPWKESLAECLHQIADAPAK